MDCNKDEASKAKEIAEKKFIAKDFVGARNFAQKAQNLYPGLEGISSLLATLDIHLSIANKINGEVDWYAVLGITPEADDEAVRKQYKKLALMLHPDKNKAIGADEAFKYISAAWSVLSDKSKRMAYYQQIKDKMFQKTLNSTGVSSACVNPNVFNNNIPKASTSNVPVLEKMSGADGSKTHASSHKPKPSTFWTLCNHCKMEFEYLREYLHHYLLCLNCDGAFVAVEIAPPTVNDPKSPTPQQQQNSNQADSRFSERKNSSFNFQMGPFSRVEIASKTAQVVNLVREDEVAQTAKKREEALLQKQHSSKRSSCIASSTDESAKRKKDMDGETEGAAIGNLSAFKQDNFEPFEVNRTKDTQLDIQNQLVGKVTKEIRRNLQKSNSESNARSTTKEEIRNATDEMNMKREGEKCTIETRDEKKSAGFSNGMNESCCNKDFYDFDKDRTEDSFSENQIWAMYDNDEGMPRYYAMIHNIMSSNPVKIQSSRLKSKTKSELGPLNWVGCGLSKTCGKFKVGKEEMYNSLNSFSHKVRWTINSHGAISIYPRKGEVWAVYKNWSPNWNELTPYEVIHKYEMMEVVEDYNEELGVTIIPLVKVAGFKTVFHRHSDVKRIPSEEMFRFSHQVPSHMLTGQEASNAPKGCRQLDPAATPSQLLQVMHGFKEEEFANDGW